MRGALLLLMLVACSGSDAGMIGVEADAGPPDAVPLKPCLQVTGGGTWIWERAEDGNGLPIYCYKCAKCPEGTAGTYSDAMPFDYGNEGGLYEKCPSSPNRFPPPYGTPPDRVCDKAREAWSG
jgi:hypothetical protein